MVLRARRHHHRVLLTHGLVARDGADRIVLPSVRLILPDVRSLFRRERLVRRIPQRQNAPAPDVIHANSQDPDVRRGDRTLPVPINESLIVPAVHLREPAIGIRVRLPLLGHRREKIKVTHPAHRMLDQARQFQRQRLPILVRQRFFDGPLRITLDQALHRLATRLRQHPPFPDHRRAGRLIRTFPLLGPLSEPVQAHPHRRLRVRPPDPTRGHRRCTRRARRGHRPHRCGLDHGRHRTGATPAQHQHRDPDRHTDN